MSEEINEGQGDQDQVQPSAGFAVYPLEGGVGVKVIDPNGTTIDLALGPDDAARIAVSFLTTISLVQFQQLNRMAQEQAEIARIREMLEKGGGLAP